MAEDNKSTFGGFDAIVDQFLSNEPGTINPEEKDDPIVDPEEIKNQMDGLEQKTKPVKQSDKKPAVKADPVESDEPNRHRHGRPGQFAAATGAKGIRTIKAII